MNYLLCTPNSLLKKAN